MDKVKSFFKQFDLFSSLPTLRAKSQPETNNTCGGVLSVIVLAIFAYVFIAQFTLVTNWEKITFTENQSNELENSKNITDFMVGIGVEGWPNDARTPFVRFQFREVTMNGTNFVSMRTLQKQNCQAYHLTALGDKAEKSYKSFNVKDKQCLVPGQNFTIQQPKDGIYTILSVTANSCLKLDQNDQRVYTGCATQAEFAFGNAMWIRQFKYFTASVIFINTGFTPDAKVPATKFLDLVRTTFTINRGTEAIVSLTPYTINTDISILPYSESVSQSGYKLDQIEAQNFQSIIYFQNVNVFFTVSSKSVTIDRVVGKIDELLSYAGGLFGIIVAVLSIFMASFNVYRYELMVGQGAFNYSDDGTKIKEHDFSFFQYVKYSTYDWIKTLTCRQMKWSKCKAIDQTREEANNQLDVTLLFKKIQHFERVIEYLISDKQNIGLYLTEPPSIDEVRKTRRIAEYYQKVIKGKSATTLQDIENVENIFCLAMDMTSLGNVNPNSNFNAKSQIALVSSTTKRKLFEEPHKAREDILERALQEFKLQDDIQDVDLDQEELKIEQEIAEAFFRMSEPARRKIQQKIPLKILHRLKKKYQSSISKETMTINLQI